MIIVFMMSDCSNALHMIFEDTLASTGDICFEIVARASSGFVYSEAVAR